MKKFTYAILTCLSLNIAMQAQLIERNPILVTRTTETIQIDGQLDEAAYFEGKPADDFWLYFPTDSTKAGMGTEIYMVFDDKNLYVGVKCYTAGENYAVPTLRRDYRASSGDNISILFDPFNDRINAFLFGMNPYGVRREALISGGGQEVADFATSWDNKWRGETKTYDGYWIAEFAIPFKTLRYNEGETIWRFNSYRFDTQSNETSCWMRIPRNQLIMNLAFMGEMHWQEPPPKPGMNFSLIPYAATNFSKDFEENQDSEITSGLGGDAKVAVTSGLNLDLTFNPDFSQVEVDQQVTNLTRFEVLLPERRQFFQENSDLFGRFGSPTINPFFSRRIGIARDSLDEPSGLNPIYYGARLSGKLDNNWRLGLLNMQTAENAEIGLPSYNYTVAAIQRKLFSRSNVGAIMVNKQNFEKAAEGSQFTQYNRVVGVDYNLASSDNSWVGKAFYHKTMTPEKLDEEYAYSAFLVHTKRTYEFGAGFDRVGENHNAEVGFVPRRGFDRFVTGGGMNFFPVKGNIIQHSPGFELELFLKPDFGRTDHTFTAGWEANFKDFSSFEANFINRYTYLFEEFNPTRVDTAENNVSLIPIGSYNFSSVELSFESDRRKPFSVSVRTATGQFFNGQRYGISGSFNFNFQPRARVELNYNINHIRLPDGFDRATLLLIGPRIDVTFSKQLFLTTFLQYNNQNDNFNINTRLQWRFQPVSDFFLVYTDNYLASDLSQVKNRAIIAKVTYWLNL